MKYQGSKQKELQVKLTLLKIWYHFYQLQDHPNIERVYEFFSYQSYFCVVTEYIPNGYLMNEVMKRNYLAESKAAYVIKQVISDMKYSHDKGVAHRNIRQENV